MLTQLGTTKVTALCDPQAFPLRVQESGEPIETRIQIQTTRITRSRSAYHGNRTDLVIHNRAHAHRHIVPLHVAQRERQTTRQRKALVPRTERILGVGPGPSLLRDYL